MMRLKSKLLSLNAGKAEKDKMKVYSPRNCEELRIPFKTDKIAKVVGKLASVTLPTQFSQNQQDQQMSGPILTGVLVQNDFKLSLMAPEDLHEYAGLTTTTIICRQRLTLSAAGIDLIRWALEGTFGTIEELPEMRRKRHSRHKKTDTVIENGEANGTSNGDDKNKETHDNGESETKDEEMYDDDDDEEEEEAEEEINNLVAAYLVMGCVAVRYYANGEIELEWEGNLLNDGIADAVMAVLFSVESSPAAVKRMCLIHTPFSLRLPSLSLTMQNLANMAIPITTMNCLCGICTQTSAQRSSSAACACFWRPSSAPIMCRRSPSPGCLRSRRLMTRRWSTKKTRRARGKNMSAVSWNAYTSLGSLYLASWSRLTKWKPRSGWTT